MRTEHYLLHSRSSKRKTFTLPTRTKQSFQAECDINNILRNYHKTGLLNHANQFFGSYGDFTGYEDYHDCYNRVLAAQDMFLSVPAKIRQEFDNDPGKFVDFVTNPENAAKIAEMGLTNKPPAAPKPLESKDNSSSTSPPPGGAA